MSEDRSKTNSERAAEALARLDAEDLCAVVTTALGDRRADDGDPALILAATILARGMLGLPLDDAHKDKPQRMADVAWGAHVKSISDPSVQVRHLAVVMDLIGTGPGAVNVLAPSPRPPEARRRRANVSREEIEAALQRPSRSGRVTDVAIAMGIVEGDARTKSGRLKASKRVAEALKKTASPQG